MSTITVTLPNASTLEVESGATVLDVVKRIGPGLATRIIETRTRRGIFGSVDELRRVRGIGDATLAR